MPAPAATPPRTANFRNTILTRSFDYGFATALMLKDVRLCAEEARELDVPSAVMRAVLDQWEITNSEFGGDFGFHRHRQDDRAPRRRHGRRGEKVMSDDIHEVYAVRYAEHARMRSENYIFGDPHDEMTSIAYYVWVIKGPHGAFVCDTGFDEAAAKERGRKITHPVGEGLKALGVEPDKVQNVIATHMHWDHAGNYDLFPNARYHVQDTEMAYATGRCMCHPMLRMPFSEGDVHAMVAKIYAYRVDFHDGVEELAPGITVHKIGGHSKGLQCVRVKTKRGTVVVASDCIHLYSHIDEGRVFPITYSVGDTLEGYKTIQKLATSRQHIVPGHDPTVLDLYPAASAQLKNWVCRLDVEPKAYSVSSPRRRDPYSDLSRGHGVLGPGLTRFARAGTTVDTTPTPIPQTRCCDARRCRREKQQNTTCVDAARVARRFPRPRCRPRCGRRDRRESDRCRWRSPDRRSR